jgi:hypothetical protein
VRDIGAEQLDRIHRYREKYGAAYLSLGQDTFTENDWLCGTWIDDGLSYADTILGTWFMGNSFVKKAEKMMAKKDRYYGGYQGNFLERIDTLYPQPERGKVLHLCAGNVDLAAFPGDTLDIKPELNPTYCCNAETCEGVPLEIYNFVLTDPYYSDEDANRVGQCMINRNKVIETLSAGLPIGARIGWLDQVRPMYSRDVLKCEAVIGIVGSTNHRFRVFSVFRKIAHPVAAKQERRVRRPGNRRGEPVVVGFDGSSSPIPERRADIPMLNVSETPVGGWEVWGTPVPERPTDAAVLRAIGRKTNG